jgi:nucleotide-binding universal stress UspA family protein
MTTMPGKVERILIATDYSSCADRALAWGLLVGRAFGARVAVLHVAEAHLHFSTFGYSEGPDETKLAAERTRLERHVAALAGGGFAGTVFLEVGNPPLKIREVARREAIDLIVMGTHGTSHLERLVFGSVAKRVVQHSGCPVLVVPPAEPA